LPHDESANSNLRKAAEVFNNLHGVEAIVEPVSITGGIIEVKFSGSMCHSCGVSDYFDDFALISENIFGIPFAVWEYEATPSIEIQFLVRIVRLDFLDEIRETMKVVGDLVKQRMREFREMGKDEEKMFEELCFCLLTANYTAEGGIRIQETIGDSFCNLKQNELSARLKMLGYRFPKTRANYIVESRKLHQKLGETLKKYANGVEAREWLVENVKGFGYKESSHFLRNVGYDDVAIIDRHILRLLKDKELIPEIPKTLNKKRYFRIERLLSAIASKLEVSLGEMDLYLWCMKTGKVLK